MQKGRNCWRMEAANRFALLIDGAAYYGALAKAMRRAERWIALLAWDLDTRTHLVEHEPAHATGPFRQFLRDLVSQNPDLQVYVLSWNFPILFANVRDPKLAQGEDPFEHPRIHFKSDDIHPPGGSHHQKIAIVDGKLAFTGGMDVAGGRWDTSEHHAKDPRRGYPPSHDVQSMVDGNAAAALAEIVRERWRRATGDPLPRTASDSDPWPEDVRADITDVNVAISRTDPLVSCREVERLHLDLVAAARRFLYIENQYLTSPLITDALSRRLQEPEGPEIVIVLPLNNHGWLEDHTVEALRYRQVRRIRKADCFGRLRISYPTVHEAGDESSIVVHSKIVVADDRLFRVGSANLTDRSMALDTECDLTIEASDEREQEAITHLRNRLLGEHLGLTAELVEEWLRSDDSPIRLIDSCSKQSRCLRELPDDSSATQILPDELIDPSQPLTTAYVVRTIATSVFSSPWAWIAVGIAVGYVAGRLTASRSQRSRSREDDRRPPGSARRSEPSSPQREFPD
jgi:phosphatidylserine/phosphatidylglycerophosphate/cardiolipin synthase-like enzyme